MGTIRGGGGGFMREKRRWKEEEEKSFGVQFYLLLFVSTLLFN